MTASLFEEEIHQLNFSVLTEKGENGVLLTNNYENIHQNIASPDILFALETAKTKFGADAVYFRHFQDNRASVPQLYLFDYTTKKLTPEAKNQLHIQMWSGHQVPAYIIIEKSAVTIIDSRKKPSENRNNYAFEIIKLTGEAIKTFNGQSFDNGLFWEEQEQNEKKHFKFEQSATRDLIRGLKAVYKNFQERSGLNRHVALKLLVQSLLIKYLEERDEKSASGYFAGTYFKQNFQCEDFCHTIRSGKLLNLLDKLANDFNGKIFEWHPDKEKEERLAIQKAETQQLAQYLDGNIQNNQYVLWRLYSFSHLPVEVISSVYEELLTDSKDIVYTPEMIVSTLVDECMPLKAPKQNFKLIDVSCGSGIFLVKAFKRLVQWWRYEQWEKTGKLVKPPLVVLKELLASSIFGLDVQQDAVRLSVFSLALAILDEVNLDPPTWEELKFPDLSENIVAKDFFHYIANPVNGIFDLVIGNPPFNLPEVEGKEPDRKRYFNELKKSIGYHNDLSIPDENPALHFLTQSIKLLKENAILCMIQPSGPLLYQNDLNFKKELFSSCNLLQILDFTKLADKLWGKRKVATVAVFIEKSNPDLNDVLHLIVNRNFPSCNRLFLEFDYYDFQTVSKHDVLNNPYIWKSNLLGGGRIVHLIERLSNLRTFKEFITDKVKNNNWKYSEGYTIGKKKHYSEHLHKKLSIKPEHFLETGIEKTSVESESHFEKPRKNAKEIFLSPHMLIKETIGTSSIPVAILDYDAVFSHEILGIHAPKNQLDELKEVYDFFIKNNKVYRFYILATSNLTLVSRASSILKKDIDNLPFPERSKEFSISASEMLLIDDVLSYQLKGSDRLLFEHAQKSQLEEFSAIFCKTLNSVYSTEGQRFKLFKVLESENYFALHFEYTSNEFHPDFQRITNLENYLLEVIPMKDEKPKHIHIQNIMKIYAVDCVILVKPKQLRYWLPSIALRDADETFADYIKARYTNA